MVKRNSRVGPYVEGSSNGYRRYCKFNIGTFKVGSRIKVLTSGEVFQIKKILEVEFGIEDDLIGPIIIRFEDIECKKRQLSFDEDEFEILT